MSPENRIGGLEIARDGEVVSVGTFNRALPIDGGTYKISAHAPGNAEWSTTVTVGVERDAKTVEIPKLKPAALGAVVANTSAPKSLEPNGQATAPNSSKVVPIVIGVGAVALLGGGLGFDLWASSTYDNAKAEMTSQARRDSLYGSANDKRYVAEGMAIAGVAAAGVAVWLYLRHPDDASETSTATARNSHLVVSPMGIALVGGF